MEEILVNSEVGQLVVEIYDGKKLKEDQAKRMLAYYQAFLRLKINREGNPEKGKKDLIDHDWWMVLNNNEAMELIVLKVPEGTMTLKTEKDTGLLTRVDKKDLLDLNINITSLIDRKSGVDFSEFVYKKIKY